VQNIQLSLQLSFLLPMTTKSRIRVALELHKWKVAGPEKDKSSNILQDYLQGERQAYWFIKRNDLQGTD